MQTLSRAYDKYGILQWNVQAPGSRLIFRIRKEDGDYVVCFGHTRLRGLRFRRLYKAKRAARLLDWIWMQGRFRTTK